MRRDTAEARAYLASVVPMASGSVDRIEQVPSRLAFLFDFDPAPGLCATPGVQEVLQRAGRARRGRGARRGAGRRSRASTARPFRAAAGRVKAATGQKGKPLFHPIRVALTGEAGGPELDLAVPAIDRGAELPAECRPRADSRAAANARGVRGGARHEAVVSSQ